MPRVRSEESARNSGPLDASTTLRSGIPYFPMSPSRNRTTFAEPMIGLRAARVRPPESVHSTHSSDNCSTRACRSPVFNASARASSTSRSATTGDGASGVFDRDARARRSRCLVADGVVPTNSAICAWPIPATSASTTITRSCGESVCSNRMKARSTRSPRTTWSAGPASSRTTSGSHGPT